MLHALRPRHKAGYVASFDVREQLLKGRAVGRSSGKATIVVAGLDQGPTGMGLAADIGLGRIILSIEGVELLIQSGAKSKRTFCGQIEFPSFHTAWTQLGHYRLRFQSTPASYTVSPENSVRKARVSPSSSIGQVRGSRSTTIRSACDPTDNDPIPSH